jgi:hypothetical protein
VIIARIANRHTEFILGQNSASRKLNQLIPIGYRRSGSPLYAAIRLVIYNHLLRNWSFLSIQVTQGTIHGYRHC